MTPEQPFGRKDCEYHLRCLKELTADEVIKRILDLTSSNPHAAPVALTGGASRRITPSEKLTVAVCLGGGLGDVIIASRFVKELFRELDHCEIDIYYPNPDAAKFVFHEAAFVKNVHATAALGGSAGRYDVVISVPQFIHYEIRDWSKLERVSAGAAQKIRDATARFERYKGLYDKHPQLDGLWGRISVQNGRNVVSNLGYLSGLSIDRRSQAFMAPDPLAYAQVERVIGRFGAPYITMHDGFDNNVSAGPGQVTKCWPLEHWASLAARLKARFPDIRIIQLGSVKSRAISGVDVNLIQRTSLHEAAWLIKNASLHVDSDSGLVHLAKAVHTRSLVLFGPTDKDFYGYDGNVNVAARCCGNCWWSTPEWLGRCPRGLRQPECMASILPEEVFNEATRLLNSRKTWSYELTGRRLYDAALLQEHAGTLQDIFFRLGMKPVPISQHARQHSSGVYLHASKQWEYLFALDQISRAQKLSGSKLKVADVGGGRGALAPYLGNLGHGVDVFDKDYLWDHRGDASVGARYMQWAEAQGCGAHFASPYNLPAEEETYDAVTSVSVVEHVPYKEYILKEGLRVLKPGGLMIITFDFAFDPQRLEDTLRREIFSPQRLEATLAAFGTGAPGFTAVEITSSVEAIQRDQVLGIPPGMTVGGIVLQKIAK